MTPLYVLLGVLIFVVAILASIGLHECGHMIPAKKFGGKVTQYFIGFGPTVWSRQVGETEYGVKAIPLGGYVKIVGMLPPGAAELAEPVGLDAEGNPVHRVRKSNTGLFTQLISDARAAEWELVKPEDTDRLFYKLSWWKKVIVMAGGPTVNIAIAFGIFAFVFATYGNPADQPIEPVVSAVSECALPSTEPNRECRPTDPRAPANTMGFELGDRIVRFNGVEVSTWPQVQKLIRSNDNGQAVIDVVRDGERVTLTGNTRVLPRPTSATDETPIMAGFLGISPTVGDPVTGGVFYTVEQMGHMTLDTVQALGQLPVKVWDVAQALVGIQERDPEGPMSIVGGGRIAGEITAEESFPVKEKAVFLLMLIAGFNFFIGMFNFVPLLPLDGGHIAGALWEGLRRGIARVFRRPDPGYVDVAKLLPIAYVMAAAFLVMGVVLIVADVFIPIHLTS
jgi:membrane-associated protease RseP (regulator of RpoE activity)